MSPTSQIVFLSSLTLLSCRLPLGQSTSMPVIWIGVLPLLVSVQETFFPLIEKPLSEADEHTEAGVKVCVGIRVGVRVKVGVKVGVCVGVDDDA